MWKWLHINLGYSAVFKVTWQIVRRMVNNKLQAYNGIIHSDKAWHLSFCCLVCSSPRTCLLELVVVHFEFVDDKWTVFCFVGGGEYWFISKLFYILWGCFTDLNTQPYGGEKLPSQTYVSSVVEYKSSESTLRGPWFRHQY